MPAILYGSIAVGIASAGVFKLLASGAQDAGEALNEAGSGALKIALAAGGAYYALKQFKVIK